MLKFYSGAFLQQVVSCDTARFGYDPVPRKYSVCTNPVSISKIQS